MMRTRSKDSPSTKMTRGNGTESLEWEMRPGGMLVQKRNPGPDPTAAAAPMIRVRVKYGPFLHEIRISSQATFGELKKLLAKETGLHQLDMKLIFKDKERESKSFLDTSGVKDKAKMTLLEDTQSQVQRRLEMRRNATMEKAVKSIAEVSQKVEKLAKQVSALESITSRGKKVAEQDVLTLIELLMTELIKLDGIVADGAAKDQRRMQVRRVQRCVETLDSIKIRNSVISSNSQVLAQKTADEGSMRVSNSVVSNSQVPAQKGVVVTTTWETFDSSPAPPQASSSTKLNWEFFY